MSFWDIQNEPAQSTKTILNTHQLFTAVDVNYLQYCTALAAGHAISRPDLQQQVNSYQLHVSYGITQLETISDY